MRPIYLLFGALAFAACDISVSNPPPNNNPPPPDDTGVDIFLTVNGFDQDVSSYNDDLFNGEFGDADIELEIFSDPVPGAIDDELTVFISLIVEDRNQLLIGEPLALGRQGDLLWGDFDYSCFCASGEPGIGFLGGTVTFDIISDTRLRGVADLTLEGPDFDGTDLGFVEVFASFDVSDFGPF